MTILQKVQENREVLNSFSTHTELTDWAKSNDMDNRVAFSNFKKALLTIGVNYTKMRNKTFTNQMDEVKQSAVAEITLYSDAKASNNKFSICDQNGEVVWHGQFFDKEGDEQSQAEMAAAKKAVWVAAKVADIGNITGIRLNLIVDAQWLCYANGLSTSKVGGKARELGITAKKLNVDLHVTHISGKDNPADYHTTIYGYKSWRDGINQITTIDLNE